MLAHSTLLRWPNPQSRRLNEFCCSNSSSRQVPVIRQCVSCHSSSSLSSRKATSLWGGSPLSRPARSRHPGPWVVPRRTATCCPPLSDRPRRRRSPKLHHSSPRARPRSTSCRSCSHRQEMAMDPLRWQLLPSSVSTISDRILSQEDCVCRSIWTPMAAAATTMPIQVHQGWVLLFNTQS